MAKFMVGDIVQRTKSGGNYAADYKFTIKEIVDADGMDKEFAKCRHGSLHCLGLLKMIRPVERPWKPVAGEVIRVTNSEELEPAFMGEREFLCMHEGRFVCKTENNQFYAYANAKPMPRDTTITLANGVKVKLSEESYAELERGIQSVDF